ncbi:MAG: UDP-N-acetylglucosamine 1-carboxyvinyltransferase [Patescibacteria group bacterium]
MANFKIEGRGKLKGTIKISGAKNAALKILPAAILANSTSIINNVPEIADIHKLEDILSSIGTKITHDGNTVTIDPTKINSYKPDSKLIKKLRGSIVVIGPLLAKFGKAVFSEPGGCLIGARSIEEHLDVFAQMGVKITKKDCEYHLKGKPKAGEIILNKMSVTATENAIMSAVLAKGITQIHVAAAEPEIEDLANYLNKMGAKITGAGTHDITIQGVSKLEGKEHEVLPDRIEAGTYLMAAVATNSEVKIGPLIPKHLSIVLKKLETAGAKFDLIIENNKSYIKTKTHGELTATDIDTRTYPGFPTDLQSPYAVLMTQAKGKSQIFETLFEGRFLYIDELKVLGAKIDVLSPHIIQISGVTNLKGTRISSRDIRGGAALVIAALIADGTTTITDVHYIDRGYEQMDQKLIGAGVNIERV